MSEDVSTRVRILDATFEVLARNGQRKFAMSDVAAEAGVSRFTLYYWFSSKEELLSAFAQHEQHTFDEGINAAISGLHGDECLDAALRFIVEYQSNYSLGRMISVEPAHVLEQMSRALPHFRDRLRRLIPGPDGDVAAAAATRIALSHYMIKGDDEDVFLDQMRQAVRLNPDLDRSSSRVRAPGPSRRVRP